MSLKFLTEISNEATQSRAAAFAEYRSLLESSMPDGEMPGEDRQRLVALIQQLSLKPAQIEAHANALTKIKKRGEENEKLTQLREQREQMTPDRQAFLSKKARLLAELDAEAVSLWGPAGQLDQQIQNIENRLVGRDEIENEQMEFFGIVAPPPRPTPNERQQAESQRRIGIWTDWCSIREVIKARQSRKGFTDAIQEVITMAMRIGREINQILCV